MRGGGMRKGGVSMELQHLRGKKPNDPNALRRPVLPQPANKEASSLALQARARSFPRPPQGRLPARLQGLVQKPPAQTPPRASPASTPGRGPHSSSPALTPGPR